MGPRGGRPPPEGARVAYALFRAAVQGYAAAAPAGIGDAEWRAIVPATATILVELAARFCADALNERYFGWDPRRFGSRSEHNEVRARPSVPR